MVTAEERDYLWRTYASDSRARINLGIRRRLAPLMENDRRKIELMNALLLSMPGTPVLYYGDELGMGDNYYLGDRDGVRTPMQWSADRNGGFSRANPQQLYLPPIMDPVYGFQAVNIEAQQNEASSLLNWMRRMIGVRKQYAAFGRGALSFLYPRNRKILAYIRSHDGVRILCVANLSRQAQAVEIDLSEHRGAVPIELTGGAAFPPVGELPYQLTLPAFGFFWFLLTDEAEAPLWHAHTPDPLPEFVTLTARGGRIDSALEGRELQTLERDVLPQFLANQRWFGGKGAKIRKAGAAVLGSLDSGEPNKLVIVTVDSGDGSQRYFLPMTILWGEQNLTFGAPKLSYTLARVRYGPVLGALIDGSHDERFISDLISAIRNGGELSVPDGKVAFSATDAFRALDLSGETRGVGVEQSNVSVIVGDAAMLKVYKRLNTGEQPEIEVARFLTEEAGYRNTPAYLGSAEYVPDDDEPVALAAVFSFVRNQGDAWGVVLDALERDLDEYALLPHDEAGQLTAPEPGFNYPLDLAGQLGRRTGELHAAFAVPTSKTAFKAEPIRARDIRGWVSDVVSEGKRAFATLDRLVGLPEELRADVAMLMAARKPLLDRIAAMRGIEPSGRMTRIHGDFHLGQVLVAQDDVVIIDFEGEPQRSLAERRGKSSGLRDVAGMLRSFDYAAWAAVDRLRTRGGTIEPRVARRAFAWRDWAEAEFLAAYWPAVEEAEIMPHGDERARLLELFLIQKAFYELGYEANNRPAWLSIPVRGLLDLITPRGDAS
jgi:maltose alpha-D-glucosyltransferase/alpha-amylase